VTTSALVNVLIVCKQRLIHFPISSFQISMSAKPHQEQRSAWCGNRWA